MAMQKIVFAFLILCFSTCAYSRIYKCKDDNGSWFFSDKPGVCNQARAKEKLQSSPTVPALSNIDKSTNPSPPDAKTLSKAVSTMPESDKIKDTIPVDTEKKSGYNCEGKTRCPQMVSCEEAMFYLKNCPNVQIDGDNDGVPCEQQWCQ